MLTPEYYDKCTRQLIALYAELDNAIISDITRRLLKTGEMTETAQWQAKQLQESGMVYDDILNEISRRTGTSQAEIKRIFEEAGVTATMNDNEFAKAAGFKEIRTFSKAALQTLNAGYVKCAGNMNNLTLTTANASQQLYINAVNNAYMQIMSGAFDYNTAIRNAVRAAAADGAEVIYPSGHRDKLDVAVRRSVLTGVGQTCRKLSEINARDMGTDLMEITAHAGARHSHAEWQGKVVSLSGRKGYLSKSDIGYGTGDGFGGWNCRHDWYPFFEGISTRAYSDERLKELNAKNIEYNGEMYSEYEISQMQRKMERDIRQLKREAVAADTGTKNADSEELAKQFSNDFTITSVKLKEQEKKLKDFLNETGQLPDTSRVWSNGFDRSVSQKAVHTNKKILQKLDDNDIINIDKIMKGYGKYINNYPDSNFDYYMINYKLKEAGFKNFGVAVPAKPKNAILANDPSPKCNEPDHIFRRMKERNITESDLKAYMNESKVMFVQWNGQRQNFRTDNGSVTITKHEDNWYYKTTWSKNDFNDEEKAILEVIKRYVR